MYSTPLWLKTTIALIALVAAFVIGTYFFRFGLFGVLGNQEEFGQFGDYVGGLLNPLLTTSSVLILLWSVRTQAQQLRASNEALHQSQLLHQEQLAIQRRESIRAQLQADAESYVASCERLMDTPIFHITTQEPGGATLSINDTFKNQTFWGIPKVSKLIEDMPERVAGNDTIALHLNKLRVQLWAAVTSTCSLIQYLDLPPLRLSWEMRLRTLITDLNGSRILTELEARNLEVALVGALSTAEQQSVAQPEQD